MSIPPPPNKLASLLMLLAVTLGCGSRGDRPELGLVSGTVTLDGKPLAGVIISFKPDVGRAASAVTEDDGKYTLVYRYRVNGAKVGSNTVSFAWPTGSEGGPGIPEQYSSKSTLKEVVEAGDNQFDFDLKSK